MRLLNYLTGLILLIFFLAGCTKGKTAAKVEDSSIPVRIIEVEEEVILQKINIFGKIYPEQMLKAYSKVAGDIETIFVREGEEITEKSRLAIVKPDLPGTQYAPHIVQAGISGTVLAILVEKGETITQQTPLFEIGSLKCLVFKGQVFGQDRKKVKTGQTLVINDRDEPGELDMVVTRVSPQVDHISGGLTIEAQICFLETGRLYPGQSIDGYIISGNLSGIALPRNAVIENEDQPGVFIAEQDMARFLPVQILDKTVDYTIVRGLDANAKVIIEGNLKISPGSKIKIVEN